MKFKTTTHRRNKTMSRAAQATVDFQLLDNGTAKATATPADAMGNLAVLPSTAGVPVWSSSDPAVLATADASDPSGLTAILTPTGVLATGVIVSLTSTDTVDPTKVITGKGDPINVVGGPAASFVIKEQ